MSAFGSVSELPGWLMMTRRGMHPDSAGTQGTAACGMQVDGSVPQVAGSAGSRNGPRKE